jgi:hypothetical protein
MTLLRLDWGNYLLLCGLIILIRWIFLRILPFRMISVVTAVTIGFLLFFATTVLRYLNNLHIPIILYSFLVCLGYVSFLVGIILARSWLKTSRPVNELKTPRQGISTIAVVYCLLWVGFSFIRFLQGGGLSGVKSILFGGVALANQIQQIGEQAQHVTGLSILNILTIIGTSVFICLWIILFMKMPKRAILLYLLLLLFQSVDYFSRTGLLGRVSVPILAWITIYRPSKRRLAIFLTSFIIVVLTFFSWYAATRVGQTYSLTSKTVVSDTMRDAGDSGVRATIILASKLRGDSLSYMESMLEFLIPRSIWKGKLALQFNYEMTWLLTGRTIGNGTSVLTSTMLGEAWYYFGWMGTIWIFLMFGFFAYSFERFLTMHILLVGLAFNLIFDALVQIRSTFLTFFQNGVISVLIGVIVLFVLDSSIFGRRMIRKSIQKPGGVSVKGLEEHNV